ncbi:ent-kaurenoic acid oxidase-like isoform X2 [Dioscorea cayenensis subsp. rotundata]|uniref:Ent-kaurenoic acid oxidase-like isoform X2 n=1 Tax=Dioscorea cayennensis subsp. rotundata TaxID=55577 RepID=A0AB40BB42_DIOCR|nr:ent-kaurenoic acid oxidase-like isoform X2 [Dioscorea cayenensis subsp. rotundata]
MTELWGFLMAMEVVVVVVVVVLMLLLFFGKMMHEWWHESKLGPHRRRSLPPGDMGFPFIGNMWSFLHAFKSHHPDSFIASFVSRFDRIGIYKAFMFGSPTILVTTPEICKIVLMDDERFIPGWPKSTCELIGKRSFVGIIHEEHKRLRRLTSKPINGHEALSSYLKFIEETVISTLDQWSSMGQIQFLTELRKLTFKIIMHIFVSSESESMMEAMERVYTDLNYGMRAMAINLPGFAYHRALKARKKLVAVLKSIIEKRRGKQDSEKKDMMDALMEVEDENRKKLDDEEIIDILIMYLNAGHESSGHITMWATVFLQEHQEYLQIAKLEQEQIRKNIPQTQQGLTLKEYRQMEYLSKVIDETLRIVNISFVAFRQATTDVMIQDYIIPKDWKVQLWYRNVHMDPEVYPDPKAFKPSRWNGLAPKAGTFLPFGGGSRLCPGNDLAKLEISIFLHYFLLDYKLERLNPQCPVRYLPHPRPTDNCLAKITKFSSISM